MFRTQHAFSLPRQAQLFLLGREVYAMQAGQVFAQNLALGLLGQRRAARAPHS